MGWHYIADITPNAWVAITAVGTWVLVIGTLIAVRWQVKAQRAANAVAVLVRLTETWEPSACGRSGRT